MWISGKYVGGCAFNSSSIPWDLIWNLPVLSPSDTQQAWIKISEYKHLFYLDSETFSLLSYYFQKT